MTTVHVRVFALIRDQTGEDCLSLRIDGDLSARSVLDAFFDQHAQFRHLRPVSRLAVNKAFVCESQTIDPSDELAIIPPVSGG